jgi:hypothetical protein
MTQENPQTQNQPDINEILMKMPEISEDATIIKRFREIPLVFVEGHSLVKVAVTRDYINCSWRFDDEVLEEGCFIYDNGEINPAHGIYYAPRRVKFPIKYVTGLNILLDEAKKTFGNFVELARNQINRYYDPNRWLIKYYNHHIRIYNYASVVKGEVLKFPLLEKHHNLYVVKVPRINLPLKFEIVNNIQVGDYKISFSNNVVKFKIYSFGGYAQLIYNGGIGGSDYGVTQVRISGGGVMMESHKEFTIHRGDLLLFAQGREPKPKSFLWAREIKFFKPE